MAEVRARKRGDKWEYRFEGAAVDGKRKQYSKSGFRTKKEALEAGAEAFAKYNRAGSLFREKDISFSDYLDYWLEIYVKANLKMTTYELYDKLIRLHVKPRLGQYRLAALKPYVFQEFANTLTEETDLSRTSIHHIISCVHGALSYAVSPLNYIEHNPVVRVKIPESAPKPKHKDVLTLEQFEKVLSYVDKDSPYRLIMIIAMYTGMRENEILSLTWDKVDLDEGTISIVQQIHKNNVSTPKTETSERKIDFGSALHKVLQEERKNQLQNRLKYGKFYTIYKEAGGCLYSAMRGSGLEENMDFVCRRENGERVKQSGLCNFITKLSRRVKIPFSLHTLRHSHATILVNQNVNIKAVQDRLGHSNIQTTLNVYVHNTKEQAKEAADRFEKVIEAQK